MTNKKLGVTNFRLLFDAIDFENCLGYAICQACCLYWAGMTGLNIGQRIWVVSIVLHKAKTVLVLFSLQFNTIG